MNINSVKTKHLKHNYLSIKQGDYSSKIELYLCGSDGSILNNLTDSCQITLMDETTKEVRTEIDAVITNGFVSFSINSPLNAVEHTIEIKTASGVKFPSDGNLILHVSRTHEGADVVIISNITRQQAMDELTDKVLQYMVENAALFKGEDGKGLEIDGVKNSVTELEQIPVNDTNLLYSVGNYLYFREANTSNWIQGADIQGADGKNGTVVTISTDGYLVLDGVKSSTLVDTTKYKHTHAISDVTGLQSALDGKLTKTTADTLYAPINSTSGGTTTPYNVLTYIDVVAMFGLKDTSLPENENFDNYDAIKAWNAHYNTHTGLDYRVLGIKEARSQRIRQVDENQNTLSGSADDLIWTSKYNKIYANGTKFISMPTAGFERGFDYLVGDYYRSKNCHLNLFNFTKSEFFEIHDLIVDGEADKVTFPSTATQNENANIKYNGKTLAETVGHMIGFSGCKYFKVSNSQFLNASVDCVNIAMFMDYSTYKATNSDYFEFENCRFSGGGRLAFAMIGGVNFSLKRCYFGKAGTLRNSQGKQIYYSPAMCLDIEPHISEIAGDNNTASPWRADKWNGHALIEQCFFEDSAGGAVALTSTLLTKFVEFRQNLFKVGPNCKGNYYMINSSLRGASFIDNDFRGLLADGGYAKIIPFGAGLVNEQTGVINGEPANATTNFIGNSFEKCDFWTNYDASQTYNDAPTGQYGMHRIYFERNAFLDSLVQYKNRRQFTFINNVFSYSANESKVSKLLLQNSIMKDNVFRSEKSSTIELDFGSGDKQSVIENMMLQQGKFTIASTSKATKVKSRTDESLDIYYQTPMLEYLLTNSGTGTSTPPDTTPPNAPTVNTVYTTDTTLTGTAEANSTVTATFNGANATTATATSGGAYTITKPSGVTLTSGMTISVTAKDAAGNTSTATTTTVQTASTTNLYPDTTRTLSTITPTNNNFVVNSILTLSFGGTAPKLSASGKTLTIEDASSAHTVYAIWTMPKANTRYTVSYTVDNSLDPAANPFGTMGIGTVYTKGAKSFSFTTDANKKFGMDMNAGALGGATADTGLFNRTNGGAGSTSIYSAINVVEG